MGVTVDRIFWLGDRRVISILHDVLKIQSQSNKGGVNIPSLYSCSEGSDLCFGTTLQANKFGLPHSTDNKNIPVPVSSRVLMAQ